MEEGISNLATDQNTPNSQLGEIAGDSDQHTIDTDIPLKTENDELEEDSGVVQRRCPQSSQTLTCSLAAKDELIAATNSANEARSKYKQLDSDLFSRLTDMLARGNTKHGSNLCIDAVSAKISALNELADMLESEYRSPLFREQFAKRSAGNPSLNEQRVLEKEPPSASIDNASEEGVISSQTGTLPMRKRVRSSGKYRFSYMFLMEST